MLTVSPQSYWMEFRVQMSVWYYHQITIQLNNNKDWVNANIKRCINIYDYKIKSRWDTYRLRLTSDSKAYASESQENPERYISKAKKKMTTNFYLENLSQECITQH